MEVIIMVNRFVLNAISYHGKGANREIPGLVAAKGYKKAFIASDPDLVKFGVTKKVTDLLDAAGMAYEVYSDIKPNPTIENVQSGVAAYKASGADYMITIGGGSSMDTGKAIGIIINNPEFADVRSLEGVAPTKNRTVFTIAVPTTAGTAAEATINYVITDVQKKRKFVCECNGLFREPDGRARQNTVDINGKGVGSFIQRQFHLCGLIGVPGHCVTMGRIQGVVNDLFLTPKALREGKANELSIASNGKFKL